MKQKVLSGKENTLLACISRNPQTRSSSLCKDLSENDFKPRITIPGGITRLPLWKLMFWLAWLEVRKQISSCHTPPRRNRQVFRARALKWNRDHVFFIKMHYFKSKKDVVSSQPTFDTAANLKGRGNEIALDRLGAEYWTNLPKSVSYKSLTRSMMWNGTKCNISELNDGRQRLFICTPTYQQSCHAHTSDSRRFNIFLLNPRLRLSDCV